MDGASYHRSKATMQMLERLRVPVMMTGPYSYDACPAELFFAAFKRDDINPNSVPVSKTHFETVTRLVVDRCLSIPRFYLILNWHHTLLYTFKYLTFHEI